MRHFRRRFVTKKKKVEKDKNTTKSVHDNEELHGPYVKEGTLKAVDFTQHEADGSSASCCVTYL